MADDNLDDLPRTRKEASQSKTNEYYLRWKAKNPESYENGKNRTRLQKIEKYKNDPVFRESRKAYAKARYLANRDEINARRKGSASRLKERERQRKPASKSKQRQYRLAKYGLTLDQYDQMKAKQGGVCAICGNEETAMDRWKSGIKNLKVDHDHKTGKVRGLLCHSCNTGIGKLRDDVAVLRRAIEYLDR